mgnify:CR=1 FL=1
MRPPLLRTLLALLLLSLAGCGFQLRGAYSLPYESIYISAPDYVVIGAGLKRLIRSNGSTRLAESAKEAQATFLPTSELRQATILSLSSAGRVREKRLTYRYSFRMVDAKNRDLILPVTVDLFRDISYADSDVLAKTQEEDLLWRDMENDLVQQLMRRIAATRPQFPTDED